MAKSVKYTPEKFKQQLEKSKTEEDVKAAYAKYFDIDYSTSDRHDLYTPQVLFEFKYDKNLQNLKSRATVLAQSLYYIRRLKYKDAKNPVPLYVALAEKNTAFVTPTTTWKHFYDSKTYDWDLAPSNPDARLIADLMQNDELRNHQIYSLISPEEFNFFSERLNRILLGQEALFHEKKIISEDNFEEVFEYWNSIFGDDVRNGLKTSRYFVCDIQEHKTMFIEKENKVVFMFDGGDAKVKQIFAADYINFWNLYYKVSNPDTIRGIIAKIDRLTDETMRRFHGEFFTPIAFAKKALDYIARTLGENWWQSGEYRIWDMAAGTGNLEYHLPADALPYAYLSTLYFEDIEHLKRLFPAATTFQYDYLNDDVENLFIENTLPFNITWRLPANLRADLANPKIKWLILINPPFATAGTGGTKGNLKEGVADTAIRKQMHVYNFGETSRELFSQFLYRIKKEFEGKITHLGLFSKIKYLNANNDQKLRDEIFKFTFEKGFLFSIKNFVGTTGNFPVGFLIWALHKSNHLENQTIDLDIFDNNVQKIDIKTIRIEHKNVFLNKWVKRPAATIKFVPFSAGITPNVTAKDRRDRIAPNFLASLMAGRNDFQHQNLVYFLSAPAASAGAYSVTPENFEKSMVIHAVQRIPKATWTNDRDQFMQPNAELPAEFIDDCTVWSLFSNSNQTVALQNVQYENDTYQIPNHFFPFLQAEIKKWTISNTDIALSITTSADRFVATYLTSRSLSNEAQALLDAAKEIYKFYFANLNLIRLNKFKISTWDAGWWQIRNCLDEQNLASDLLANLKTAANTLRGKILPQIYTFGFL